MTTGDGLRAAVIVASTSAAAGTASDDTGPVLTEWLATLGFATDAPLVVADGAPVGEALRAQIAADVAVGITTGGTGLAPSDRTPEQTSRVLDRELPGIAEALRAADRDATPLAALGRGVAGVAGSTVIVNVPGSPAAVRSAMATLEPVLAHAVDLVRGSHGQHGHRHRHRGHDRGASAKPDATANPDAAAQTGAARADASVAPAAGLVHATVTDRQLSIAAISAMVARRDAGAVATFEGVVRDHDEGRGVARLQYESHPAASALLTEVGHAVASRHPQVTIAVEHRVALLEIGDVALAAAVSSAHRVEAFAALADLVDSVKRDVPIWKSQQYTDGSTSWVDPGVSVAARDSA